MTLVLVRGSTDRLKLDWSQQRDRAVGPDGFVYEIQSETIRYEGRSYFTMLPTSETEGCPYGYEPTLADARKVCEWYAWKRASKNLTSPGEASNI